MTCTVNFLLDEALDHAVSRHPSVAGGTPGLVEAAVAVLAGEVSAEALEHLAAPLHLEADDAAVHIDE